MTIQITYCGAHQCGRYLAPDDICCPHGVGICEWHTFEDACDECYHDSTGEAS